MASRYVSLLIRRRAASQGQLCQLRAHCGSGRLTTLALCSHSRHRPPQSPFISADQLSSTPHATTRLTPASHTSHIPCIPPSQRPLALSVLIRRLPLSASSHLAAATNRRQPLGSSRLPCIAPHSIQDHPLHGWAVENLEVGVTSFVAPRSDRRASRKGAKGEFVICDLSIIICH